MQLTRSYRLGGGLDLVTPMIVIPPGRLIAAVNYEPTEVGASRIDGYERYDGRPKPSDASYWVLNFDAGTATIAEGATVTGATSGATGKALIAMVVSTGSLGGGDAAGYLVLTTVSGTFQDDENLQVAAATKCVANGAATENGASNDTNHDAWTQDAIETARALIATVTGSGVMRGVWSYNGVKYAFRNNAGGTAVDMWKSSTSGWTAVALGSYVQYDGGTVAFAVGDTVTGATSGASGVVTGMVLRTGTYAGSNATGLLTFATIVGGPFQNNENLQVAAATRALADGASAAITLPAGGKYRFINHNFFGASDRYRMYGCNGVGPAFEFDGTTLVPIYTGMTTDTPNRIAEHKNHLCLAFPGGSFQHSGVGDPYAWSPITGAAEIGIGDDITGFGTDMGGVLVIGSRNRVAVLYGTNADDWAIETISPDSGMISDTAQRIGNLVFMDDQGVRSLRAVQAFGDFKMGTLTQLVYPLLKSKKANGVTPVDSVRVRAKNQYRLFFSDGTGITIFLGKKDPEIIPFDLDLVVSTICSSEDSSGNEEMFFGAEDGYVYQLDSGTSFDGDVVSAYARPAFDNQGTPTHKKRYHKITLEIQGTPQIELGITAEFSYGDADQPSVDEQAFDVAGGGAFWDEVNWDEFYWSSPVAGIAECHVNGIGTNISFAVASEHTYEAPHHIHGVTVHYSTRGLAK